MAASRPAVAACILAVLQSFTIQASASEASGLCLSGFDTEDCASQLSSHTANSIVPEQGLQSVDICPPGQYPQLLTGTCIPCSPGRAKAKPGTGPCIMCGLGSYAAGEGNTKCRLCPAGTFSASRIATSCTPCPAGKFSPKPGAHECISCFENHVSREGSAQCTRCARGTYTEGRPGAASCVAVPSFD